METTKFIWGGEAAIQYELKEHLSAYFSLPFLVNTGKLSGKTEYLGQEVKSNETVYFGTSEKIYAIPKIGIMYKF